MTDPSSDTDAAAAAPAAPEPAPRLAYRVLKAPPGGLKVGCVLCAATAVIKITKADADALNSAVEGTVEFAGI